jgi:hypothetical protein
MNLPIRAGAILLALLLMVTSIGPAYAQGLDDPFVAIPDELTTELRIKAAYNGEDLLWRFEWPAATPAFYHDVSVYQDGAWVQHGQSTVGSQEYGLYEDRLTFLVDPGTVRGFANQGCYVTCHSGLRFMSDQLDRDTIQAHPFLGEVQNRTDLRKYLPDSRVGATWWDSPWDQVKSQEELDALAEADVFLDFWHWRAHRGGPIGYADDQYVLEFRKNDGTRAAYATNWDADAGQPRFMYDPDQVGFVALNWETLLNRGYTLDDYYYLSTDIAVPFDPEHPWQNGDVIPRRFLQEPEGSQASILSNSTWDNGFWRLELRRPMDTGFPTTDHATLEGRTYNIGFAIHKNATGSRWHYISHPVRVGIGTPADIMAVAFAGDAPNWDAMPWITVPMFYPAQINWEWLTSEVHPGAPELRADTRSCVDCHGGGTNDVVKLAQASVHWESTDTTGPQANWYLTLLAGFSILVAGTVFTLSVIPRKDL